MKFRVTLGMPYQSLKVNRRQLLRGATGAALGLLGTARAAQAQPAATAPLQLLEALNVNLFEPTLLNDLLEDQRNTHYSPLRAFPPTDFEAQSEVPLETLETNVKLIGVRSNLYALLERGRLVNTFTQDVIYTRQVSLELRFRWALQRNLAAETRQTWVDLIGRYLAAVQAATGDPPDLEEYLGREVPSLGLSFDQVAFAVSIDVIVEASVPIVAQGDPMIQYQMLLAGKYKGTIVDPKGKEQPLKNDFERRKLTLKQLSGSPLRAPNLPQPQTPPSPLVVESSSPITPKTVANKVLEYLNEGIGCNADFNSGATHSVMTLLQWPEFKVEWETCTITIRKRIWRFRISFTIRIPCPRLYTRVSNLTLVSFVRWPKDSVQAQIAAKLSTCALRAALIGAVVGVALGNPGAASLAFEGAFERCLEDEAIGYIACLIPGIAVNKITGQWK